MAYPHPSQGAFAGAGDIDACETRCAVNHIGGTVVARFHASPPALATVASFPVKRCPVRLTTVIHVACDAAAVLDTHDPAVVAG